MLEIGLIFHQFDKSHCAVDRNAVEPLLAANFFYIPVSIDFFYGHTLNAA
ncbi:hypothetical protein PT7_0695 [Pusillimonas sp. T7-7]|nr:hypothetical protein PT7_0695 [Pusillimonas sp. T7-7]